VHCSFPHSASFFPFETHPQDGLVNQLTASSPLHAPALSNMLCGKWIRQGSFLNEIKEFKLDGPRSTHVCMGISQRSILSNFVMITSNYTVEPVDEYSFVTQANDIKLCLFRLISFKLKPPQNPMKVCLVYLDSDMHITITGEGPPHVFVKPDEQTNHISRARHILDYIHSIRSTLTSMLTPRSVEKGRNVGRRDQVGAGLIGDVLWRRDSVSVPEENLLHQAQQQNRGAVIGDLIGRGRTKW
jgi:hypothetical protein